MNIESKRPDSDWDRRLQEVASNFQYPATPDMATAVHERLRVRNTSHHTTNTPQWTVERRRLAMALLVALFMLVTLLAAPSVRAGIARFFQVGAITIFVGETEAQATSPSVAAALPTKQPTMTTTSTSPPVLTPLAVPDMMLVTPQTATPIVTLGPTLEGPLTLAEATEVADFEIRLPGASSALGPPDEVYLEHTGNADSLLAVILVWFDPHGLQTPRLALYQIGAPEYGSKLAARESVMQSEVNGQPAYWIEGKHLLQIPDANGNVEARLVGHVLLWTESDMTYRLEGAPFIDDAITIAQSLQPSLSR